MSDISQGNVTTLIRCGGIFDVIVTTNFLLILSVKKYENGSIFDEIIGI